MVLRNNNKRKFNNLIKSKVRKDYFYTLSI